MSSTYVNEFASSKSIQEVVKMMTTPSYDPSNWNDPKNSSGLERKLIPVEFADPRCPVCEHIIREVNEIFELGHISCPDPREYCVTHLFEAVHTSLIWRLSKV
jgi:hypothetical protein